MKTFGRDFNAYDTSTAGVVVDSVTGLMWQREVPAAPWDWAGAAEYCDWLVLAGFDDWRLPTRIELVSIVDYGRNSPAIDAAAFSGTPNDVYWSSSPYASDSEGAWTVDFTGGHVNGGATADDSKVRCVRAGGIAAVRGGTGAAGAPPGRYTVGSGTVLDNETGLMWQHPYLDGSRTWRNALVYCEELSVGGYSDWRLPSIKELQTLVDEEVYSPAIDTAVFVGTTGDWFWSSSPYTYTTTSAWAEEFADGVARLYGTQVLFKVRCVR
jgi:hypothetical protein